MLVELGHEIQEKWNPNHLHIKLMDNEEKHNERQKSCVRERISGKTEIRKGDKSLG